MFGHEVEQAKFTNVGVEYSQTKGLTRLVAASLEMGDRAAAQKMLTHALQAAHSKGIDEQYRPRALIDIAGVQVKMASQVGY